MEAKLENENIKLILILDIFSLMLMRVFLLKCWSYLLCGKSFPQKEPKKQKTKPQQLLAQK